VISNSPVLTKHSTQYVDVSLAEGEAIRAGHVALYDGEVAGTVRAGFAHIADR